MRGPYSRDKGAIWESTWPKSQRADTARVLPVALSYVAWVYPIAGLEHWTGTRLDYWTGLLDSAVRMRVTFLVVVQYGRMHLSSSLCAGWIVSD